MIAALAPLTGLAGCGGSEEEPFGERLGLALAPLIETHGAQDLASGAAQYTDRLGRQILSGYVESQGEVVRRLAQLEPPDGAEVPIASLRFALAREVELKQELLSGKFTEQQFDERICCTPPEVTEAIDELQREGFIR